MFKGTPNVLIHIGGWSVSIILGRKLWEDRNERNSYHSSHLSPSFPSSTKLSGLGSLS